MGGFVIPAKAGIHLIVIPGLTRDLIRHRHCEKRSDEAICVHHEIATPYSAMLSVPRNDSTAKKRKIRFKMYIHVAGGKEISEYLTTSLTS